MLRRIVCMLLSLTLLLSFLPNEARAADAKWMEAEEDCHSLTEEWFGNSDRVNAMSSEEDFSFVLSGYFQTRSPVAQDAVQTVSITAMSDEVRRENDEWTEAVKSFQERVGIQITDSVTTSFVDPDNIVCNDDGTVTAYVYEWTFFDYDDLADDTVNRDTTGFGIPHKVTMVKNEDGTYQLLTDEYDAADSFGVCTINESTYREIEETGYEPVETDSFIDMIRSGDVEPAAYSMYSAYDPFAAVTYSDKYVYHKAAGGTVYEQYYNSAYPNYNASGGDCTNYTSQCIYAGGMPMVKGTAYGRDGWFFTSASNRSGTWTFAPYLRDWMAEHRGKLVTASDDTVYIGSPVFYNDSHATFCVGRNSAGVPIINSHNKDWYHAKWNYYNAAAIRTVQLTADDRTPLAGVCQNVTAVVSDRSVKVTFGAADNAQSYDVYLVQAPWGWDNITHHIETKTRSVVFEDVPPGVYCAFVIARPNSNFGKQSKWVSVTIKEEVTVEAPEITASSLMVLNGVGNEIRVSWQPTENAEYYIATLRNKDSSDGFSFNTSETSISLSDIPGGVYDCFVTAYKDAEHFSEESNHLELTFWDQNITPVAAVVDGQSQYLLFESALPWPVAKEFCEYFGGHLATVNSSKEDEIITGLVRRSNCSWAWIGACNTNGWKWLDGTAVPTSGSYANWGDISGNACPGPVGIGDFLLKNSAGTWYGMTDVADSSIGNVGFVCEVDTGYYYVTLNSCGGSDALPGKYVFPGQTYGELPEAFRVGYKFLGWFTKPVGGERITEDTVVTSHADHELYAHWENLCPNGHDYVYEVNQNPTADSKGSLCGVCKSCGNSVLVSLPQLNAEDYFIEIKEGASCTTPGSATYTWKYTYFGTYSFKGVTARQHSFVTIHQGKTCLTPSYDKHTCVRCGYSYRDNESPASGHKWDNGVCSAGVRTFTCQVCKETVSGNEATFTSPVPFKDVPVGSWFYLPVMWACDNGISEGTGQGMFSPNTTCTRGQIVTLLWRAAGQPEPSSNKNPFTDVKSTSYYYKAILWASENKIASGVSSSKFSPDTACTRSQVVTMLYRAAGSPPVDDVKNPFTDISVNAYYYKAVLWAATNGITSGISKTTFAPDSVCTRAQIVTFLYNYYA